MELEALTCLGLTQCSAKIFLVLASSGSLTVKMIAKKSNVTREQVYSNLRKLEKIGFVEKIITAPTQYEATPLEQAMNVLFEKRRQKTLQLEKAIKILIQKTVLQKPETKFQKIDSRFVMFSPRKPSISRRRKEIENAQKSIDFISSWKRFPKTVHIFENCALDALKRGVKMRVILEKPPNKKVLLKLVEELIEMSNYELKYTKNSPSAVLAIFDKKRAIIKTSASVGLAEAPSIWTNNQCILSVFNCFFECEWNQAMNKFP
jgi:sugar-specific transcriptional regulator TrmB